MVEPIDVLRAVAIKGRARADDVAVACGAEPAAIEEALASLLGSGDAAEQGGRWKATDEGRAAVEEAYASERQGLDRTLVSSAYERFCALNGPFKEAVTAWQMKADGSMNDHADAAYDADVLGHIGEIHQTVGDLLVDLAPAVSRLTHYRQRLAAALERARAGESTYVASPMVDSYHSVWFELHEDLIRIAGLTRAGEAAGGRA